MILSLILFIFASIANAIQYTVAFRYEQSIFTKYPKFFGPRSARNKYASTSSGELLSAPLNNKYYKRYRLIYKERFPLSATILVFLTDAFHLFQFLRTNLIILAILTFDYKSHSWINMILVFLLYRIIYSGIFELCYSKLFIGILFKKPIK